VAVFKDYTNIGVLRKYQVAQIRKRKLGWAKLIQTQTTWSAPDSGNIMFGNQFWISGRVRVEFGIHFTKNKNSNTT
jgi:uncharacterized membrane protein